MFLFPTRRQLRLLVLDDDGLTTTEYAAILALIVIVCINASLMLGNKTNRIFETLAERMMQFTR